MITSATCFLFSHCSDLTDTRCDAAGELLHKTQVRDEEHFSTKVTVCASPTFYSWVFQWGGKIKIIAPKDVVMGYQEMARKALED